MSDEQPPENQRVSVSLAQLRSELTSLELRLVDRLNGALVNKADRAIQEQLSQRVSDYGSRITIVEQQALRKDGPVAHQVAQHESELISLRAITGYKKLIIANTLLVSGLVIALVGLIWNGGTVG